MYSKGLRTDVFFSRKRPKKDASHPFSKPEYNRLELKTYPDATTVDYAYDLGSRLTSIENPASSISYSYDTLNRIQTTTQNINTGPRLAITPCITTYEYDEVSNRTKLTYPSGYSIDYAYDELNRLISIEHQASSIATYSYDTLSRRTYKKLHTQQPKYTRYSYDLANQLLELENFAPTPYAISAAGLSSDSKFAYTYDDVGNRLTMATPQRTHTYGYNDIYELASSRVSSNTNLISIYDMLTPHDFTYDSVGNREVADGTSYTTNNLNQYTDVGGTAYSYNANGNLTSDGTNTYTYDVENRLIAVEHLGSSIEYQYDAFGRRISKTVDGTTTYFICDGDQVIEERGAGGLVSYTYGTGIDEVLTMQRDGETYYYFYDGLGSVSDITDSSGEVVESYTYDVYGIPSQLSTIGNPYYFTGRRFDEESGLYYYRARYYSPNIGRFLQRDPVTWAPDDMGSLNFSSADYETDRAIAKGFGLENSGISEHLNLIHSLPSLINQGGANDPLLFNLYLYVDSVGKPTSVDCNLYHYAHNNPINFTDPYGEYSVWIVVTAVIVLVTYGVEVIAYSFGRYHPSGLRGGSTATTFMWDVEQIKKWHEENKGDKFGQIKCKK